MGEHDDDVFMAYTTYPVNSMVPTINNGPDGKNIVTMLVTADGEVIEHIKDDCRNKADFEINAFLSDNKDNLKDIVMRFDIFYPNGHATYDAYVYGTFKEQQRNFVKTLKNSDTITVLIANQNRKVEKVIPVDWDYRKFENTLNRFII